MTRPVRVRFAPSPTGPLHIGGVRTALYNYLFARKHGGTFLLRVEDTDQGRYVPGAEAYITESLRWCGLEPDEGPEQGGPFAPYRQSERRTVYEAHAQELVRRGAAYHAFDTPVSLEARRLEAEQAGTAFRYDAQTRMGLENSLTLPAGEVARRLAAGEPAVIRLKVPAGETVAVEDLVRGQVVFNTDELDDKVLLKADGMPTYHLANIVDDHLMEITHVIRGEEWLPSTGHHVLLYQAFGWEATMPRFAHLPLILKPDGKGKLSKRDGARFGIPVFPLAWDGESPEDSFRGVREYGFLPSAVLNFLAFLGWNPGTDQELFSLPELAAAFSLDKISKGGARFDYDKAKWFNQQYLHAMEPALLATWVRPWVRAVGYEVSDSRLQEICRLMKDRLSLLSDLPEQAAYLLGPVRAVDAVQVRKRWDPTSRALVEALAGVLSDVAVFDAAGLEEQVKSFAAERGIKIGQLMPLLRLALAGTMQGPMVFDMMQVLGREAVRTRLHEACEHFDRLVASPPEAV
jgi:glutamyl-tRNA synthetase